MLKAVSKYCRLSMCKQIGRKPGPALTMFSVVCFHYYFLITYTLGHRKVAMTTPNSGPFTSRVPETLFRPEIKSIQIFIRCGAKYSHRTTKLTRGIGAGGCV